MKKLFNAAMLFVMSISGTASANTDQAKAALEAYFGGKYKVESVVKTPLANMYEIRIGMDLMYIDDKGQFLFVEGQMIDLKSNQNLTALKLDELLRVKWDDLPLDIALKQVNGNGKRKVAVFEDPNCPHCRTTRNALNQVKDVTIYTFTYPILSPDSEIKVKQALCAKDKLKAWNELVLERKVPANDGSCANNLAKVVELGRKLKVTGTPTLIFADGKRIPSGTSVEQLNRYLDIHSKS